MRSQELFQQLAELLATAERPIAQRWYEAGPPPARRAGGEAVDAHEAAREATELAGWSEFVCAQLEFLFHAADVETLPVPASLGARLLRQAVLIDDELTAQMLRSQLLSRVMLFAPDSMGGTASLRGQSPLLAELQAKMDKAVGQLLRIAKA